MALKAAFRKYLGVLAPHDPFAALISKKGKWFVGRASSSDFEIAMLWKKVNKPKAKDCWYNAQRFVSDCGDFRYFEGYVQLPGGLSIEHAWVVMEDGRAVDFTLEAMEKAAKRKKLSADTSKSLYFGVEIPLMFIREQITATCTYQSLAEAYCSR